jgi:hypothetical protein
MEDRRWTESYLRTSISHLLGVIYAAAVSIAVVASAAI